MVVAVSLSALIAYLLGSVLFGVVITKKIKGIDPREYGSHSAGTTNAIRIAGAKAGIPTFLLDVLKGTLSVFLAAMIAKIFKVSPELPVEIASVFVMLGHIFPIFFGFNGGKGVATFAGASLLINPMITLIILVFAIVLIALTNMVSIASITIAILYPILMMFLQAQNTKIVGSGKSYVIMGIVVAIIILISHRENISRLKSGKENAITVSEESND